MDFFFFVFSRFLCNFVRNLPQNVEKILDFRAEKNRRILSRLWLSWFFQSRFVGFFYRALKLAIAAIAQKKGSIESEELIFSGEGVTPVKPQPAFLNITFQKLITRKLQENLVIITL